jgi:hypothetical protein
MENNNEFHRIWGSKLENALQKFNVSSILINKCNSISLLIKEQSSNEE